MQPLRFALLLAELCLWTAPAMTAETSPNLIDVIKGFEHLEAEPASRPIQNLRLTSGHLQITFSSGSSALVRAANDTVGLVVEGAGTLEYRTVDPIEFPVFVNNVRKGSSLSAEKTDGGMRLRETVRRVLWLAAGQSLPELPPASAPPMAAAFEAVQKNARAIQGRPFAQRFAIQRANSPASPLVVAMLEGTSDTFEYVFDGVESRSEFLSALRSPDPRSLTSRDAELKDSLFPRILSNQPIGRDRRDPLPPAFLLTDVSVDLTASAAKEARLVVEETIVPQAADRRVFRFRLHSRTYKLIGSGALDARVFRLREVSDETGRPLRFHHEHGSVLVETAAPAPRDRPLKLRFRIDGDFLIRPGGDNFWELGVEPWFPQPEMGEQYYTWRAVVRVPRPFVPFSSGATVSRRTEGEMNIVETRIEKPVQFAVVLAGKYESDDETRNGITVRVASYAMRNARAMKQLRRLAFAIIDYYQAFLGPFPFPEFQILEINEYGWGQAPPGVMFITKEAFNPIMGEENQLFSQGINERFAHEIAHQYWGHVVKMPNGEEQWLTESFAEYSASLFLRQFKGEATYKAMLSSWRHRADHANAVAPIPLANEIYDPDLGFLLRQELLYDKGPVLLAALHRELGDDLFLTFLKSYQKSFAWKFGTTKNVAGLLQFLTKKDFTPFFTANFWGTGMP